MSEDLWEFYRMKRHASQDKRAQNRHDSTQLLLDADIEFEYKNNGAHLIVYSNPIIDFWPGTGKWIERTTQFKGRGIHSLLKHIKES